MVTGILEVAAAYQTIQPIASLQIQLIKDIYKTIKYIRELAKEYKTRFETHAKLVEEVDLQYLRLGKSIEGLEQLSNGNTLDDANRESIDRKLNLLGSDLQRIETRLKTFMEQMTVGGGNPNTTIRKFKRFFGGLDFVSASREELQTILDTSRIWSDSITVELTLLLVMDNHKVIHEKSASSRDISVDDDERKDYFESFKPLNLTVTKDASETPIMRLVKRITSARKKAFALNDLNIEDLQRQIIPYDDIPDDTDIELLEYDYDTDFGVTITVMKGTSKRFAHCIIDHPRSFGMYLGSGRSIHSWIKETIFLATILSSYQNNSDENEKREKEDTLEGNYDEDLDILPKCVGVIGETELNLVFKLPPSTDPNVRSLRKALTDPESQSHPIDDRYSLALHLAQSIFLIHSAGIIHRHVRPEAVFLADRLEDYKENKYPKRLGKAFLFGYGQTRKDELPSTISSAPAIPATISDLDSSYSNRGSFDGHPRRSVMYRPPRHLLVSSDGQRNDRYRMIDDIYGLGVCLLEIGLWTSLFKHEGGTYVEDNDIFTYEEEISPYEVQKKLIQKARDEIPRKSGNLFMKIVISCIDCFNKEIPGGFGELGVEVSPAKLLRKYEELVLNKLRKLVDLNRTEW